MTPEQRAAYRLCAYSAPFLCRYRDATSYILELLERAQRPYVSFSGGKDSTALLILLAEMGRIDVPVFTQADDLDWPDKHEHCHSIVRLLRFENYDYCESDVSAAAQFADMEAPGEITGTFSHVIDRYVTDHNRDGVILGIRAAESKARRQLGKFRRPVFQTAAGTWQCMPLMGWGGEDVFALIVSRNVPYMRLYDCPEKAPHEWRMSWPATPQYWRQGSGAILRRHFPEYFARLTQLNPRLRDYV